MLPAFTPVFRSLCLGSLFMVVGQLAAQDLGSLNKSAEGVQKRTWTGGQWSGGSSQSDLLERSFPITDWQKRYSSLGSQRAGGVFQKRSEKKFIEKKIKNYDTIDNQMSGWNEYISSVYERAGIQTDQRSKKISDRALYSMMLQDQTKAYEELGEQLSLRDINRFQFRRNRDDGEVPVESVKDSAAAK